MTAEIAVMNEEALALAADSAVTGPKIFTSANKIFNLSKYHPVGVMVFDSAQFLHVPWETIIKQYRRELGRKSFPTLEEHAEHFLAFFDGKNPLFPDDAQRRATYYLASKAFGMILKNALLELERRTEDDGLEELTEQDVLDGVQAEVDTFLEQWRSFDRAPNLPARSSTAIAKEYRAELDVAITDTFERLVVPAKLKQQLRRAVALVLTQDGSFESAPFHSGVVIAGFGAEDVFPRLTSFHFESIALNRLKFTREHKIEVGPDSRAFVVPFAQKEQVVSFIDGLDPVLGQHIAFWWHRKLGEIVDEVAERLGTPDDRKGKLAEEMEHRIFEVVAEEWVGELQRVQDTDFSWPIIKIVAMLPKDELAAMAESFVNLTSFKRRVSEQAETVGGPIDVAVISRGDGFIWIKRKHYFTPELNPQFFANYYSEESDDAT